MEFSCSLTKLELDAVLQLIQLSSGSGYDDLRLLWVDLAKDRRREGGGAAEESSISSSSSSVNDEEILDDEPLPRINHKYGSLIDIYGKTHTPFVKNRSKKMARF